MKLWEESWGGSGEKPCSAWGSWFVPSCAGALQDVGDFLKVSVVFQREKFLPLKSPPELIIF